VSETNLPVGKEEADLRNMARLSSLMAIAAVFIIASALLAGLGVLKFIEPFARATSTFDWALFGVTLAALAHDLVPLVPIAFYLLAVLGAAGILDHIGKGEYFSERNIRALADMGGSMAFGGLWAALLVPSISDWTAGRGGYRTDVSPEVLVILTIGGAILVIGRLFLRARRLETEIGEIV
jgi:hypothetical protein